MIRAPFIIVQAGNTDPAQASHIDFHLAAYGLDRLPVYSKFPKTKMALVWRYKRVVFLGTLLLSLIPCYHWEWRPLHGFVNKLRGEN